MCTFLRVQQQVSEYKYCQHISCSVKIMIDRIRIINTSIYRKGKNDSRVLTLGDECGGVFSHYHAIVEAHLNGVKSHYEHAERHDHMIDHLGWLLLFPNFDI